MPVAKPNQPSPWLEDVVLDYLPSLRGEHRADVAIVGGGLTGLSTALELARQGMSVAVLEAETSGYGASGRNAGHLSPTIGKDIPTLLRLFGRQRTGALLTYTDAAIGYVERLIRDEAIDCDYEPVGNMVAAVEERQHKAVDHAAGAAREWGLPAELLGREELAARGVPRAFTRALVEPHGGVLHPGKLCRSLRRLALEAGATIFDRSPVATIDEAATTATVVTGAGRVRAERVVLATNAYTPALGRLRSAGLRLHVQLFRTKPLSAAQLGRLPWSGREGIYTAHEALESYRLTVDNRIVGGSKWVRYGFNNRALIDVSPRLAARWEDLFHRRFPELDDVTVERHWGGPIFLGLDFLPSVGCGGKHGNILHSLAYAGHGLAHATYAGRVLADLVAGREGAGSVLMQRRRIPSPPEPFRWLVFHTVNGVLTLLDRRADARAAGRSGR